jgi:uncharacterized protein YndB with AHSA1/START domain
MGESQAQNAGKWPMVITREFDAPREKVWKAFTEAAHAKNWWGPKGFTTPVWKGDVRVGGMVHSAMQTPDGKLIWGKGIYRELVKPKRLVVTDSFADEKGNTVQASHYAMDADFPLELLITITFEEHDGKTTMTLTHGGEGHVSDFMSEGMREGWNESFDKLDEYLKKM